MPAPAAPALPNWAQVHGDSLLDAQIRTSNADFEVTELLDPETCDDGEHDYLWIEKTGANTQWLARRLAQHAGIPPRDVGYAGLKDRHAVTRQWFSVRRPGGAGTDWSRFDVDGVKILDRLRHARKLRRGAHRGNDFRITLRSADIDARRKPLIERLQAIADTGVPNYFGPQRFGRDGGNVGLARRVFDGKRIDRDRRGLAISAARALLFNTILDARVRDGSWNRLLPGERANLDGSGSLFDVTTVDETLQERCQRMDIHPTGTLWGRGAAARESRVAALESSAVRKHPDLTAGLEQAGIEPSARPLRLPVRRLRWTLGPDVLVLQFRLPKGGFATSVLRELANLIEPDR